MVGSPEAVALVWFPADPPLWENTGAWPLDPALEGHMQEGGQSKLPKIILQREVSVNQCRDSELKLE